MRQLHVLFFFLFSSSLLHAQPLRIGVSESILSLPVFIAESEGYFNKRGVEVELVNCIGGNRCIENMLAGETELSTATELPVVLNSFERTDFSILTSLVSTSRDVKLLAKSETPIAQPADLKAKTLGYVKGTASQYVLDLVLLYSGIDPATVKLKPLTPEIAASSLAQGEVDALYMWEPFASRILQEQGARVRLVPTPDLYTETFNLIAMKSAIRARPRELELLLLALKDSMEFINANPRKAKALLVDRFEIPMRLVNSIFEDYRFQLSLNRSLSRTMEGQARWALREGHVNRALEQPNYNALMHVPLLKRAVPRAVSLP